MSYAVTQRTREIGLRIALGARARDVIGMVVGRGMLLTSIGGAAGLGLSLTLTRLMSGLLFGVGVKDPLTFVSVSGLLAGVALLACYIPARRAAKVDPMIALRCE
jgi:putative ABC transport system permease protein